MNNKITIDLPNDYWIFTQEGPPKKAFYDLCRFLINPIGEIELWILVDEDRWSNLLEIFKDDELEISTYVFKLVTPFGFVFVENYF